MRSAMMVQLVLAVANPQSLRLIQESLSLENKLDCHGATDLVLKADNNPQGLRGMKKLILDSDWKACLSEASRHQSTSLAAKITTHTTWPKLWDMALDHGAHVRHAQLHSTVKQARLLLKVHCKNGCV